MSNKQNGGTGVKNTPAAVEQLVNVVTSSSEESKTVAKNSLIVLPGKSVNERIERHAHLKIMIDRYLTTKGKTEELKSFKLDDDGSGFFLTISNAKGGQFVVNNQGTIASVLDLLIDQGELFTEKMEQEVSAFEATYSQLLRRYYRLP